MGVSCFGPPGHNIPGVMSKGEVHIVPIRACFSMAPGSFGAQVHTVHLEHLNLFHAFWSASLIEARCCRAWSPAGPCFAPDLCPPCAQESPSTLHVFERAPWMHQLKADPRTLSKPCIQVHSNKGWVLSWVLPDKGTPESSFCLAFPAKR